MDEFIKYKRKNGSIWSWQHKLYIPITLSTKNCFARNARVNRMSQAEFGAVIVMHYLANEDLLTNAIAEYRAAEERAQKDHRDRLEKRFKNHTEVDRTFGGVFKSSYGDDDDE